MNFAFIGDPGGRCLWPASLAEWFPSRGPSFPRPPHVYTPRTPMHQLTRMAACGHAWTLHCQRRMCSDDVNKPVTTPLQCHPRSRERGRFWSTVEHLCTELWLGALLYSSFHRVLFIRPERKYSAHTLHRDPETMNSRALNGIPHRVPVCSARRRNYFYIFAP